MFYVPYGPFSFPRTGYRTGDWQAQFWEKVGRTKKNLSAGQGIYIFVLRWGDRLIPYYVGMTCSTKGFCGEIFQDHKLRKYRDAEKLHSGSPEIFFVAKTSETDREKLLKASTRSKNHIDELEYYLIGMCLAANPKLRNDRKTSFHRNLDIEGVIGPRYFGARRSSARNLRKVLGLDN